MCFYKLRKKNLIGKIAGFPIEVVQKMVDYQIEQGNKPDVTYFQNTIEENSSLGFNWCKTKEGWMFWYSVICEKDFDLFFRHYPKGTNK